MVLLWSSWIQFIGGKVTQELLPVNVENYNRNKKRNKKRTHTQLCGRIFLYGHMLPILNTAISLMI